MASQNDVPEPAAGQVCCFETRPFTEFSPAPTGRYAAIKILGVSDRFVVFAVLDGIWTVPPTLADVAGSAILCEHRFAFTGKPAVVATSREQWQPESAFPTFAVIGIESVAPEEQAFVDIAERGGVGSRYAGVGNANFSVEGEWRWANDRSALVAEIEQGEAKKKAEQEARAERYRTRLKKLTWDKLLAETPFERWSLPPAYPPPAFTEAARARIREACLALQALGPKPGKVAVRAILKDTVDWFNRADDEAGGVVETVEREDIFAVLEEMAFVARQQSLVPEIDRWREW